MVVVDNNTDTTRGLERTSATSQAGLLRLTGSDLFSFVFEVIFGNFVGFLFARLSIS